MFDVFAAQWRRMPGHHRDHLAPPIGGHATVTDVRTDGHIEVRHHPQR